MNVTSPNGSDFSDLDDEVCLIAHPPKTCLGWIYSFPKLGYK